MTDGQMDGQPDGGDCNIPDAFFLKKSVVIMMCLIVSNKRNLLFV